MEHPSVEKVMPVEIKTPKYTHSLLAISSSLASVLPLYKEKNIDSFPAATKRS